MKYPKIALLCTSIAIASTGALAQSQINTNDTMAAPSLTRQEVKMERNEFLRTHRMTADGDWVLRPGFMPPAGVQTPTETRAQVKMDRDEFLRTHHEETADVWVLNHGVAPPEGVPVHNLTRQEVRMDRDEFLRTHEWRGASGDWVLKHGYAEPKS